MQTIELNVKHREGLGKGPAGRSRRAGNLPAVAYGAGVEPTPIEVQKADLRKFEAAIGHSVLFKLQTEGPLEGRMGVLYNYQRDPLKGRLVHADLLVVDVNKPINVNVPVEFVGKAVGVKEGGIFTVNRRDIEIRCLPTLVPETIQVDISELAVGENLHVADLKMPEGAEAVYDSNFTIAAISAPAIEEVAPVAAAAEAEAATPEDAPKEAAKKE